jgi:hypothetical protein
MKTSPPKPKAKPPSPTANDVDSDGSSNGFDDGFDNSNENQPTLAASETSPPTANKNQPAPKWGQLWTPEDAVSNGENWDGHAGASNDGFDDCGGFDDSNGFGDSNGFDADDGIQEPTPAEIKATKKPKKKGTGPSKEAAQAGKKKKEKSSR